MFAEERLEERFEQQHSTAGQPTAVLMALMLAISWALTLVNVLLAQTRRPWPLGNEAVRVALLVSTFCVALGSHTRTVFRARRSIVLGSSEYDRLRRRTLVGNAVATMVVVILLGPGELDAMLWPPWLPHAAITAFFSSFVRMRLAHAWEVALLVALTYPYIGAAYLMRGAAFPTVAADTLASILVIGPLHLAIVAWSEERARRAFLEDRGLSANLRGPFWAALDPSSGKALPQRLSNALSIALRRQRRASTPSQRHKHAS